jgi:hypothetical protein
MAPNHEALIPIVRFHGVCTVGANVLTEHEPLNPGRANIMAIKVTRREKLM